MLTTEVYVLFEDMANEIIVAGMVLVALIGKTVENK